MKIIDITRILEEVAPRSLQESYDNSGLIVGDPNGECDKAMICLDSTEEVIDEAVSQGCGLVIAHHPIVFSGLKKFNGKNYVERVVMKAIKNDVAIYAIHTNLDNVFYRGVNERIAQKIGLTQTSILAPRSGDLKKLTTFVPESYLDQLRDAICDAGAGTIGNYDQCTFQVKGTGTYRPLEGSDPFIGEQGRRSEEEEIRIEVIYPQHAESKIIAAMKEAHPYEEIAYYSSDLRNSWQDAGAGLIGELDESLQPEDFLKHLKSSMNAEVIRFTPRTGSIKRVAVCGGSGSFLLNRAIAQQADAFVTADFKYHQFFDAEGKLMICDIGHYESEQFTTELISDILSEKIPNFALIFAQRGTNPIQYYY